MGRSPQARSLTDRIRNEAQVLGIDPQRLRRRVVFQRLLARVGVSSTWVLKGGFCLEVRFDLGSRGTKDLDLVAPTGWGPDGALDLQDELDELLSHDRDSDGFDFAVGAPRSVPGDGRELWRVAVEASLAGTVFAQVSLDVVVQEAELEGGVEELLVPPPLGASGFGAARVLAVDVDQHAAEKIHAYSRTYAQDQPSSRGEGSGRPRPADRGWSARSREARASPRRGVRPARWCRATGPASSTARLVAP